MPFDTSGCISVVDELLKFSSELLYLGPPITDGRLEAFEKQIGFILSDDFKFIIKRYNRFSLTGTEVYGIDATLRGSSLDEIYNFEHFEVGNPMPEMFLPFSPNGRGDHYCLDLSKLSKGVCPVVFWQHDCDYTLYEVEVCNNSFFDWIKEEMIDSALEEYNYDGSENNRQSETSV